MEANLPDLTSSRGIDRKREQEMGKKTEAWRFCSYSAREQKTKVTSENRGLTRSRKGLTRSRRRGGTTDTREMWEKSSGRITPCHVLVANASHNHQWRLFFIAFVCTDATKRLQKTLGFSMALRGCFSKEECHERMHIARKERKQ